MVKAINLGHPVFTFTEVARAVKVSLSIYTILMSTFNPNMVQVQPIFKNDILLHRAIMNGIKVFVSIKSIRSLTILNVCNLIFIRFSIVWMDFKQLNFLWENVLKDPKSFIFIPSRLPACHQIMVAY